MTTETQEFRIVIDTRRSTSLVACLDMMRYDQATIIDWTRGNSGLLPDREGAEYWTLTLRGRCTRDRWASFAMPVFPAR